MKSHTVSITKDINNQSLKSDRERISITLCKRSVQIGYIINGRSQRVEENSSLCQFLHLNH